MSHVCTLSKHLLALISHKQVQSSIGPHSCFRHTHTFWATCNEGHPCLQLPRIVSNFASLTRRH